MNTRYCKDCKYFFLNEKLPKGCMGYTTCRKTTRNDLVSGEEVMVDCCILRDSSSIQCGVDGAWFEPKV